MLGLGGIIRDTLMAMQLVLATGENDADGTQCPHNNPVTAQQRRSDSVILILCRNSNKDEMKETLINFEQQFNRHHNYPYIFLNDKDWEEDFKTAVSSVVSGEVVFGKIPEEDWDMPEEIDREKAKANWAVMKEQGVLYADVESYHNMCRFFSRKFFLHPLTEKYKYYWRVEPGVRFECPIREDPFETMEKNGYEYGFTIILNEQMESIPTLWETTKEFVDARGGQPVGENADKPRLSFMFNEDGTYNGYHFYNNFEIGAFSFFRSEIYRDYIEFLEKTGGFYYERWGDAPVHTLAVGLFLPKKKVHFFKDIGYTHDGYTNCPNNDECDCSPEKDFGNTLGSGIWPYLEDQSDVNELIIQNN